MGGILTSSHMHATSLLTLVDEVPIWMVPCSAESPQTFSKVAPEEFGTL